jgi:glucose/arabinose dehydrogenase
LLEDFAVRRRTSTRRKWLIGSLAGSLAGVAVLLLTDARAGTSLAVERVAFGFAFPVFATSPPGDTTRFFICEQHTGRIKILNLQTGVTNAVPFMTQSGVAQGGEQGLLGLAFHPQYAANGRFFVYYTRVPDGFNVLKRYTVSANPNIADTTSGATLLVFPKYQPTQNHNGGWIAFGPDGYLYVAIGDGGSTPYTAQSDTTRLGKILRLDVDGGEPYGVAPSNPFVGEPSPKDEFWAKGLRNPWRHSFDRANGDLVVTDVGASLWEEVNYQPGSSPGGENYGWSKFEGYSRFNCPNPCDSTGLTFPIYAYAHGAGDCAIAGGYTYRGPAIPALQGTYFFGDYCSGRIWSMRIVGGVATEVTNRTAELQPGGGMDMDFITSFAEDDRGEVYVLNMDGDLYRIIADPTAVPGDASDASAAPEAIALAPPSPNPARGPVTLHARLERAQHVRLRILDSSGRVVRTVAEATLAAGSHAFAWDLRADDGARAAAGAYVVHLESAGEAVTRKTTILR